MSLSIRPQKAERRKKSLGPADRSQVLLVQVDDMEERFEAQEGEAADELFLGGGER